MSEDEKEAEIEGLESALSESEDEKERLKEILGKVAKSEWDERKQEFLAFVRQTRGEQTANELDEKIQPDSPYSLDIYTEAFMGASKTQTQTSPTGKVSLPPPPSPQIGWDSVESMISELSQKTLSPNRKVREQAKQMIKKLREISYPIGRQGVKSGHGTSVLGIKGSYSVCPECGRSLPYDIDIKPCQFCGHDVKVKKMYTSKVRP